MVKCQRQGGIFMDVICCEQCGKLFNSMGFFRLCPVCTERDEKDFSMIKEYLSEHPLAKIFDVANDLSIPIKQIKRYLKESRLEIIEQNNRFLLCEDCGKPIRTGRYCDECYRKHHRYLNTYYVGNTSKKSSSRINLTTNNRETIASPR